MRMILIGLPLALLAACNSGDSGNKAGNAAAPEAANASAPVNATAPANAAASADPRRANEIQECAADVGPELPAGADANAFCGCAVDRMESGGGEREAMDACAAQMGIQPLT